jgi:hypothetical protein
MWAFTFGYTVWSEYRGTYNTYNDDFDMVDEGYAEYEPEAVFKACQWILDNKGE